MNELTPRTDALVTAAQHDHIKRELDDLGHYFSMSGILREHANTLERELNEVKAALAQAQTDAKRYQLWRDGEVVVRRSQADDGWEVRHSSDPHWDVGSWFWNESLDAAIDQAMQDTGTAD